MKTLKKIVGTAEIKAATPVLSLPWHGANDAIKTEWLFARQGRIIVGIGDEELALTQLPATQAKEKCLSREQKLDKLRKSLDAIHGRSNANSQSASDSPTTKRE